MKRSTVLAWPALICVAFAVALPFGAAAAGEPDLTTPGAQALRQEWLEARRKLDADRTAALVEAVGTQLKAASDQLARARVSGNLTQQAAARTALQVFEQAAEALKKDGNLALPEQTRREVQPMVDTVRRAAEGADAVRTAARTALDGETARKLRALLTEQGTPVETDAAAGGLLPRLENAEAPPPAATEGGNATPGAATATGDAAPEAPKDPEELASNGGATDWEPLLVVGVQVGMLEIVSVPVVGVATQRDYVEASPVGGPEIAIQLAPRQELVAGDDGVLFRAMSVPGKAAPDVMALPSARNDWRLELRCRPQRDAIHSVRLDVSKASARLKAVAGAGGDAGGEAVADVPRVAVKVVSRPDGASVYVDGRLQLRGRDPLVTPCEVGVPATGAEVALRKTGHLEARLGRVVPKEGQVLQAMLTTDPDFVDRTLRVQAAVTGGHSGVALKAGQRVRLSVEGQWACGSGGELVGPEGYAIDKFPNYYVNPKLTPRVTTDAPYGALLARVGTGPWTVVGKEATLKAEVAGALVFEVNEAAERNLRRDNRGVLQVRVRSVP